MLSCSTYSPLCSCLSDVQFACLCMCPPFSGLLERRSEGSPTMVGTIMFLCNLCEGGKEEQAIKSGFSEVRAMIYNLRVCSFSRATCFSLVDIRHLDNKNCRSFFFLFLGGFGGFSFQPKKSHIVMRLTSVDLKFVEKNICIVLMKRNCSYDFHCPEVCEKNICIVLVQKKL